MLMSGIIPSLRVDPTGLYDFKNPCEKSDKQCSADFKAFKKEFKDSLDDIKAARNSFGKGSEEPCEARCSSEDLWQGRR